jgi:sulfite reductase (NADPH) flavoprotein alpha-component
MSTAPVFNLKNPCLAVMKTAVKLSKEGSPKDTRHFEIDLRGSGLTFEPGDSLAVLPTNCLDLVQDILTNQGWTGDEAVEDLSKKPATLREALTSSCNLATPDKKFLNSILAKTGGSSSLASLLEPDKKEQLEAHLHGRELIDFLHEFPDAKFEPQEFVSLCKKLLIRLYSISSSLRAYPDSVHLTVATVRYHTFGRDRKGVASTFLAERVQLNETVIPTFIKEGKGFRLPAPEDKTPVIFCGPGTGIAPFRSFLQERDTTAAKGKAWLFFGEVSSRTDFFYEAEFNDYLKRGVLTKLTTAFSRDQPEKIYVQHRIAEHAREIWEWLEAGAIFYICGDAARMAGDVDKALHTIVETAGGKTPEAAAAYIEQLRADKRYRRDVY